MDFKANYLKIIAEHDPMLPFESGFKSSLDWLNRFEKIQRDSAIIFRTRSPLVVLLAPVLRRLKSRIKLIIPIEALSDSLHFQLDPESKLPRPSERMQAAKALHQLGFEVELELQPFVTSSKASYEIPSKLIKDFAQVCDESASRVLLRKPIVNNSFSKTERYLGKILGDNLLSAKLSVEEDLTMCAA